jgi:hypothetical protein
MTVGLVLAQGPVSYPPLDQKSAAQAHRPPASELICLSEKIHSDRALPDLNHPPKTVAWRRFVIAVELWTARQVYGRKHSLFFRCIGIRRLAVVQ